MGTGTKEDFQRRDARLLLRFGKRLGLPESGHRTDFQSLNEAAAPLLEARFGALINFGNTAGYYDLHMGHRITHELPTVAQYGHTAQVRYEVLDAMVSKGFQSSVWCYWSQQGGWSQEGRIVNVRGDAAGDILALCRKATDADERKAWEEEIARESREDQRRVLEGKLVFPPGLVGRLERAALDGILAELDRKGIHEPSARRLAFLVQVEQEVEDCMIFTHEGRHAIDNGQRIRGDTVLEFRAKLSEIAFSRHPKAMLRQVHNESLGDASAHGQVDLRIMQGPLAWLESHRFEIAGYRADQAPQTQLDPLTDAQLREAVQGLNDVPTAQPRGTRPCA